MRHDDTVTAFGMALLYEKLPNFLKMNEIQSATIEALKMQAKDRGLVVGAEVWYKFGHGWEKGIITLEPHENEGTVRIGVDMLGYRQSKTTFVSLQYKRFATVFINDEWLAFTIEQTNK